MLPHRQEFWDRHVLEYKFFAEVRRLLELEVGKNNLTNVQAALVLFLIHAVDGLDRVGEPYLLQPIGMVQRMGLLAHLHYPGNAEAQQAQAFTAWCLFGFQV